ncbi:hypothetical protein [Rheinheimera salexigens]|uniref:Energy transducer TonB n=1 Tax=Rheinheimera salexigens TaxID=1628148 RepID=A0A1E7Q3V3_9GAMM|nr:hypothetical protein [Rheinheimera salexigens]OEY68819.1 hypothetical protein BI198_04010 [Rheinheimera salexigens]
MNKIILLAFVTTFGLIGCSTTNEPTFFGETVEVDSSELNQYWEHDSSKVIRLSGRPDWLPKGAGKASYFITIDSNGTEVSKELINSIPEGWMTQKLLDKMPKQQYKASKNNPSKTPVKVKISSEVKRMS